MPKYRVPTDQLAAIVNPLDGVRWGCGPITAQHILDVAVAGVGLPENRSWQQVNSPNLTAEENREYHLRRLATLIAEVLVENHEPQPEPNPSRRVRLILVFDDAGLGRAWMYDGYHRIAVAYLMQRPHVDLYITASDDDRIVEALPGAVLLEDEANAPPNVEELSPEEWTQANLEAYYIALARGGGIVPPYNRELATADFCQAAGTIIARRSV